MIKSGGRSRGVQMPSPTSSINPSSSAADADEFQFRPLTEDEKKELMNLDETSNELSDDANSQIVEDDGNKEIFEDKSEEVLAELRQKYSGDFAIGSRFERQSSENSEPAVAQLGRTFSNFTTEEVGNPGVGNIHALSPILLLFPLVGTLLVVPLATLAFKTTDQSWPPQTNRMTTNERSQAVGSQSDDAGGKSSRDFVATSIHDPKVSPATSLASLNATKDVVEANGSANGVEANPGKNIKQRPRPSRIAIYHHGHRTWHIPKRNLRFNAIY